MNLLVIDNDQHFLDIITKKILESIKDVYCDAYTNITSNSILKTQYNVIMLDIVLEEDNGIEMALRLKKRYPFAYFVFISSYKDLVFNTQLLNPLCFIRKEQLDYDFDVFKILLNHQNHIKKETWISVVIDQNSKRVIKKKIDISEIVYVEAYMHKIIIHSINEQIHSIITLKQFLEQVNNNLFVQVHKGFIVNMTYIVSTKTDSVYMLNDDCEVPIGRKYKKDFEMKFEEFVLM